MTKNSFYFLGKINTFIEKKYWLIKKTGIIFTGLLLLNWINPFNKTYTPYARVAPIGIEVRWGLFVLGVIIIVYGVFSKTSNKSESSDLICPKCEKVFIKSEKPDKHMCVNCKVELEPLEGFYNRHPELKEIEE